MRDAHVQQPILKLVTLPIVVVYVDAVGIDGYLFHDIRNSDRTASAHSVPEQNKIRLGQQRCANTSVTCSIAPC